MGTDNTTETVICQWRTSRGAVAREFFTEFEARQWMDQMLALQDCPVIYKHLHLFKVATTTVIENIDY